MFNLDTAVDTIQNNKKIFVKTFVTDEKIATVLNEFIDNQAEYTKKATKATMDAGLTVIQETMKHMQEAAKFDYVKFGEGIMKAYSAQTYFGMPTIRK
jgi:hypothetical protein